MKTNLFFKAVLMAVAAMVIIINTITAANNNEGLMAEASELSETKNVNTATTEMVNAHSIDMYEYQFYAGEPVYIYVKGDGDTDLDLYVYDENGSLINSDTQLGDTCLCVFSPLRTCRYTIKVKNLGNVCNKYSIWLIQWNGEQLW